MQRFLGWTLGPLAVLVAVLLLLLLFPPTGWIADKAKEIVAARTGYALEIGELELDLLDWTPSATLSGVTVDGARLPGLLDAGRFEVAVDLRAALGGKLVIERVLLSDTAVGLTRDAEGRTSWTPDTVEEIPDEAGEEPAESADELALPSVREIRVENLSIVVDDAASGTAVSLDVEANGSTLSDRTPLIVTLEGAANGVPMNARLELESPLQGVVSGGPVRLVLDATTDGVALEFAGRVDDAGTLDGLDLELDLDIDSLAAIGTALGRDLPPLTSSTLVTTLRSEGEDLVLASRGTLDGAPLNVALTLDLESPLPETLANDGPSSIDLDASVGGATLAVTGRVGAPKAFADVDLELDADIDSLTAIETLLGRELPDLEPATLTGTLRTEGDEYVVRRFDLVVAGSEVEGDVRANPATSPPTVHANLIAKRLDIDALLDALGAIEEEGEADQERAGPVLPSDPLPVDALFGAAQGAIAMRVDELRYAAVPLDAFDARLELAPTGATLSVDGADLADGELDATLGLEPGNDGAFDATLDLELARVRVGRFLPDIELVDDAGGPLGGRIELWASGDSVAALAGSLDGGVLLLMGEGKLDALVVELAGLDLAESVADLLNPDEQEFPMRCAYASLFIDSGVVSVEQFVIDTRDTVLLAAGNVDLGAETLDLALEPHPKDPSLLTARTSVGIGGTFAAPEFGAGPELTARAVVAVALAAIAAPATALLAFVDTGGGEDSTFCELEGALDGDAG